MAYARVSYDGDGSTTIFTVPFPYLDTSHVEVRVAGVLKSVTTHYTWLTSSTIQFVSAPANGATVYFLRNTPKEARLVNYQDAAILREADLDLDSDQSFYIVQETLDAAINTQATETFVDGADYTAGVTTALTLASTEVEEPTVAVLFDAAAQHQTEYSIAGGVITFNSAIPVGVAQVQVMYAVPMSVGLIDGSVTAPKVADLNITEPKLALAVFNDLTAVTADTGDHVVIADASDSGNKKKTLVSSILSLLAAATTAVFGLVRFATSVETQTGTSAFLGVTPAGLAASMVGGVGQSYQNVTGSRAVGAGPYTNSTGRPILIVVNCAISVADAYLNINVNSSPVGFSTQTYGVGKFATIQGFVIPNGATYSVTTSSGTASSLTWIELR